MKFEKPFAVNVLDAKEAHREGAVQSFFFDTVVEADANAKELRAVINRDDVFISVTHQYDGLLGEY